MILQQNYVKIAEYTSEVFRLYAKRSFAYSVMSLLQNKRVRTSGKDINDPHSHIQQQRSGSLHSFTEADKSELERSVENQDFRKKTVKSIVFKESEISDDRNRCELELSQVYFGDRVMMMRGSAEGMELRVVVFNQMGLLKGLEFHRIRGNNINTQKCLFEICDPSGRPRRPLMFGDIITLKNVWSGKYLSVDPYKLAQKSFGCQVSTQQKVNDQCLFRIGRAQSQPVYSNYVFTNSQIRLVLHKNPFFKLLIQKQHRMSLQQTHYHELVASSSSEDLQLIKLKPSFNSVSLLSTSQFYYLSNPNASNQLLASIPTRTMTSTKEKSFNLLIENGLKFNFTVDDIPCRGNHQVVFIAQDKKKFQPNAVWELSKLGLLEHLSMTDGDEVVLVNVCTNQYLTCSRSNKKIKLTVQPAEARVFRVEQDDMDNVYKLKIEQSSFTPKGERLNWTDMANELLAYYEVVPIEEATINDLKFLNDIQNELVSLYRRITIWGIIKDDKNQTCYTFDKALEQEYLLKAETKRYEECLAAITNFLKKDYSTERKMEQAQSKLKQIKILELLIYFCRLFVSKMENVKVKGGNSDTAFGLAKKQLEPALLQTMDVLYKLILDNQANSDVLMQSASFFNTLLVSHSQRAGGLLQQAIRNLSILHTSYNEGDQLFQWIKLIEVPTIQNVATQTKYMQILAEVMVDPSDRGIPNYQNKCYQLMFVQSRFKTKNPLAYASLESGSPEICFYYPNPGGIEEIKSAMSKRQKDMHCCLDFALLIKLAKSKEEGSKHASNYLQYFTTIFKLLRNMCKDRNKKLTKIIEGLGFTREFILQVVRSDDIDSKNTMPFLSLYMQMYMDQDPFIPFSKVQKKCYLLDSLGQCDMQTKTCIIFKQFSEAIDIERFTKQCQQHILPFIQSYLTKVSKRVCSKPIQDPEQYLLLISLIKFIYCSLNFGYLTIDFLLQTLTQLLTAVTSIITFNANNPETSYTHYFQKLLNEMLSLIDLTTSVFLNLLLVQMLVHYYWTGIRNGEQFNKEEIKNRANNMLIGVLARQQFVKPPVKKLKKMLSIDRLGKDRMGRRGERKIFPEILAERKHSIDQGVTSKTELENPCMKLQNQINAFLLRVITICSAEQIGQTLQKAVNLLSRKSRMNLELSSLLVNIELIVDEQDEKIYQQLRGGQAAQVLNIIKLETQVNKLTDEYAQVSKEKVRLQIILEINSLLKKLIKKLENYRKHGQLPYKKAQNIICKLNVYHILRTLIHKCTTKPQFKQLTCTVHRFLASFVRSNEANKLLVAQDFAILTQAFESPYLPTVLELIFDQVSDKIQAFKTLLAAGVTKTNSKGLIFESVYRLLVRAKSEKLDEICFGYIVHQPQNRAYLQKTVKSSDSWLFRVICLLIKRNPSLSSILQNLYSRKQLQSKIIQSPYQLKHIYLQLYYSIYLLRQLSHEQTSYILSKLIVIEFNKINLNYDGIVSDKVLLSITEQEDDYSLEMQRRSNLLKEARRSIESVKAEETMPEEFQRRRKKKEQPNSLQQQAQFWQYMCSPDGAQYSVMAFLKEALESREIGVPQELISGLEKLRRIIRSLLQKSGIHEYSGMIDELDYVLILMNVESQEAVGNSKDYLKNFFANLSDAIKRTGVSIQQLLKIFKIDNKDMMEYLKGTYDGSSQQMTFRDVINSFKALRQRIGYQRQISLNSFRKFYSLFRQNRKHVVLSFVQKIQQTLQQKKNAALNSIFADMRGKVQQMDQSDQFTAGGAQLQTSSTNSLLSYKGSHQLKQTIFQNYLSSVNNCLLFDLAQYKKQHLLSQFTEIFQSNPTSFDHFCAIYKSSLSDELVIEMFLKVLRSGCVGKIDRKLVEKVVGELRRTQNGMLVELVNETFEMGQHFYEEYSNDLREFVEGFFERFKSELKNQVINAVEIDKMEKDFKRVLKLAKICYTKKDPSESFKLFVNSMDNSISDILIYLAIKGKCPQYSLINPTLKQCFEHTFLNQSCGKACMNKIPLITLLNKLQSFAIVDSYDDFQTPSKQLWSQNFQILINLNQSNSPIFTAVLASLDYRFNLNNLTVVYFQIFKNKANFNSQQICNHPDCESMTCSQGFIKVSEDYMLQTIYKSLILMEIAAIKSSKEEFRQMLDPDRRQLLDFYSHVKNDKHLEGDAWKDQTDQEKRWREMLRFFERFKGKIQIREDDKPRILFFKIPIMCAKRSESVKNTVNQLLIENQGEQLHTQIYSISKILKQQLDNQKTYMKYLPAKFLEHRTQVETFSFILMILVNVFLAHTLVKIDQTRWQLMLCSTLIIAQLLPQLLFAFFNIKTNLNIINVMKPPIQKRLRMFFDSRNISIILQMISIYQLPLFPLNCILLSTLTFVGDIVQPIVLCSHTLFKIILYSLLLLLQYTMYLSTILPVSRPYEIVGSMLSAYFRVVVNRQPMLPSDLFYSTINYIPIKYMLDVLLGLGLACYAITALEHGLKARNRRKADKCLVCLREIHQMKDVTDMKRHVRNDSHNMWDYLTFFIYLERKQNCTDIEAKIKKWIKDKNWNFVKIR